MGIKKGTLMSGLKPSPWIVLGSALILLVVVMVMAFQNARRNRQYMTQVLRTKGAALIRGVEAGARTGMMGMSWGGRQVQRLLEETASLPDVLYMAVIDANGTVVAHSDTSRIGRPLDTHRKVVHLGPQDEENVELVSRPEGGRAFEVHRYFKPIPPGWRGHHANGMGRMMRRRHLRPGQSNDWFDPREQKGQIIIVGLDMAPLEQAIAGDMRQSIMLSCVLVLLGFAGFVSLFWMHSYRSAQRSLQDTSAFADEVVANLPVGLVATDRKGRIVFFNAAAEKMFAISPKQALGREPDQVLPQQLCGLKPELDSGSSIAEKEMMCSTKDGGMTVPVSVSATRIVGEQGRLVGHVLILRDLGEVHRLQAQIRRQEKLVALGALAAGVAHEIRNPLSSIKGLATYFAGKFDEGSEARDLARVMTREVDRLNRVISELLEFARPSDLKRRFSDINQLIDRSLQLIQQDAAAKNVSVEKQLSEDVCTALIDPDRFSQCLLNLFINAIQANPEGGRLSVQTRMASSDLIHIEVADTGHGIDAGDLEAIFNPYFTTKAKGTGLGLAIVHKIVEAHGGRIHVDSEPGSGARFVITLPCRLDSEDAHETDNAAGRG